MIDLYKRIDNLSPIKRELLIWRLKEITDPVPPIRGIARRAETITLPPLSFAQERLWLLDQLQPGSAAYNILSAVRIHGELNSNVLQRSFNEVIKRHEILRTTFSSVDGKPVQVIAPELILPLESIDLREEADQEAAILKMATAESLHSFDLARGPLLRVTLLNCGEHTSVLLLLIHHIISDNWSFNILIRELSALYAAFSKGEQAALGELSIQYADYAVWQRERLQMEALDEHLAYWTKQLAGAPPVLEIPADRPRPPEQTFNGGRVTFLLPGDLSRSLVQLSRQEGVTLFMMMLAAFQLLLHRYTGQEDIVVGLDVSNRTRLETEQLIGFFVNTLVLRSDLSGDPTFRELLDRVKEVAIGAYAHQDLPFEKLVEALRPERTLSHMPLFQVFFALQEGQSQSQQLAHLSLAPIDIDSRAAKFDLHLFMAEQPEGLGGAMIYNTDLFDVGTIAGMISHFQNLLGSIAADPSSLISALSIIGDEDRAKLSGAFSDDLE